MHLVQHENGAIKLTSHFFVSGDNKEICEERTQRTERVTENEGERLLTHPPPPFLLLIKPTKWHS